MNGKQREEFVQFLCQIQKIDNIKTDSDKRLFCILYKTTPKELDDFFNDSEPVVPISWSNILFEKMNTEQFDQYIEMMARISRPLKKPYFSNNPDKIRNVGRPGPRNTTPPASPRSGAYGPKIKPLKKETGEVTLPTEKSLAVFVDKALDLSRKGNEKKRFL